MTYAVHISHVHLTGVLESSTFIQSFFVKIVSSKLNTFFDVLELPIHSKGQMQDVIILFQVKYSQLGT